MSKLGSYLENFDKNGSRYYRPQLHVAQRQTKKSMDSYCTDKIQTFLPARLKEKKDVVKALLSFKGTLSAHHFLMRDFE